MLIARHVQHVKKLPGFGTESFVEVRCFPHGLPQFPKLPSKAGWIRGHDPFLHPVGLSNKREWENDRRATCGDPETFLDVRLIDSQVFLARLRQRTSPRSV